MQHRVAHIVVTRNQPGRTKLRHPRKTLRETPGATVQNRRRQMRAHAVACKQIAGKQHPFPRTIKPAMPRRVPRQMHHRQPAKKRQHHPVRQRLVNPRRLVTTHPTPRALQTPAPPGDPLIGKHPVHMRLLGRMRIHRRAAPRHDLMQTARMIQMPVRQQDRLQIPRPQPQTRHRAAHPRRHPPQARINQHCLASGHQQMTAHQGRPQRDHTLRPTLGSDFSIRHHADNSRRQSASAQTFTFSSPPAPQARLADCLKRKKRRGAKGLNPLCDLCAFAPLR